MTEHLPECWAKHDSDPPAWCICDELRACAKRVLAGASEQDYANGKSHGLLDGYEEGYSDALDAAREAVKHLQHSDDCYYAEGVLCHCEIKRAITAIDALRKEPND